MKNLPLILISTFTCCIGFSQPALTLWIAPDGYHESHEHSTMQQYLCDSSYYIFYHNNPDTLYITAKNGGSKNLELTGASTQSMAGASFFIHDFSPQTLTPGEMFTIEVIYQLPSQYANGINGHISIESNDPDKPICSLYFDVGCLAQWKLSTGPRMGAPGGCYDPVIYVADVNTLLGPNFLFNDSMKFFSYNVQADTSFKVLHLVGGGVFVPGNLSVAKTFTAGNEFTPMGAAFEVFSDEVRINQPLNVESNVHVLGTLEVELLTNPSDLRKKKEINPIQGALQKVMLLGPKSYYMIDPTVTADRQYGFIAQDLESSLPDLVHQNTEDMKSGQLYPINSLVNGSNPGATRSY